MTKKKRKHRRRCTERGCRRVPMKKEGLGPGLPPDRCEDHFTPAPPAPTMPRKKKLPCDLDVSFLEEVKDAVVFLQRGPEPATSIRSFVQAALEDRIEKVKTQYRRRLPKGGKIPKRKNVRLRQGRPMS